MVYQWSDCIDDDGYFQSWYLAEKEPDDWADDVEELGGTCFVTTHEVPTASSGALVDWLSRSAYTVSGY